MGKRKQPYKGRDRFAQKAKDEGYEARSVYKLEEVQRRFRVLKRGQRVVDLGCFPGSWSRFALEQIGADGVVVGVDLTRPTLSGGLFMEASVFDVTAEQIFEALGGPADVVLSDMAQKTTGDRFSDHVRQIELARRAFVLATALLVKGGAFVTKVFEGGEAAALVREVSTRFGQTKRVRPDAVRKVSREWFLVATGFDGEGPAT